MEVLLRTCCGLIRFFDLYGLFNTNNQIVLGAELRLDLVMTLVGTGLENRAGGAGSDMVSYMATPAGIPWPRLPYTRSSR